MSSFEEKWDDLCKHLNKWYHCPDTEGIRICLCVYISHFHWFSDPIWLSVIGPPGYGKTELAIKPIEWFHSIHSISTLTDNTLLSGYGTGNGLLKRLEKIPERPGWTHGVFTFPDLTTTILTEDVTTRAKIMGQLRRVYDKKYTKDVGSTGKQIKWEGKVTAIAACTNAIENHWMVNRDMGERWLSIRWRVDDSIHGAQMYSEKADTHLGNEEVIEKGFHNKLISIMNDVGPGVGIIEPQFKGMFKALAELVEISRTNVNREHSGSGYAVTGIGDKQNTTRITLSCSSLVRASTQLRDSTEIEDIDIHLARRMALESIPKKRWDIINKLLQCYPNPVIKQGMAIELEQPRTSFDRTLEDLRYLKVIQIVSDKTAEDNIFEDDHSSPELSNTPYGYKKPTKNALITLHPDFARIAKNAKVHI